MGTSSKFISRMFGKNNKVRDGRTGESDEVSSSSAAAMLDLKTTPMVDTAALWPETTLPTALSSADTELKPVQSTTAPRLPTSSTTSSQQTKIEASFVKTHADQDAQADLWTQAFELFQRGDHGPEMMADYKKYLASLQGDSTPSTDLSSRQSVETVVEKAIGGSGGKAVENYDSGPRYQDTAAD